MDGIIEGKGRSNKLNVKVSWRFREEHPRGEPSFGFREVLKKLLEVKIDWEVAVNWLFGPDLKQSEEYLAKRIIMQDMRQFHRYWLV